VAKQLYEMKNFSGGLNAYADPRDIEDSQFSQNWNAVVDKDGILRVVGSAVEHINAKQVLNNNFQSGFGLFQFGVDYGWNALDGSFGYGLEIGTIADIGGDGTNNVDIEATSTYSTTDNYYKDMAIFIYEGTGAGQSRRIDAYTGSTRLIVVEEAFDTALDTTSKYMIFKWKSVGFATTRGTDGSDTDVENFITDGYTANFFQVDNLASNDSAGYSSNSSYYAVSKQENISAEESADLGYLEYKGPIDSNLTLESGIEYTISFECAFKNKYYNDVSDGDQDGSAIGTGDLVPSIELFSDTVTNGTTNQTNANAGLYLQSGGRWIEKGAQTNYAHATSSYANYVVNGDFRDAGAWTGGSGNWAKAVVLPASVGEVNKYNGTDGTIKFDWSLIGTATDPTTNNVYTTLVLNTNTLYHLNFQHFGPGVQYKIKDNTNNITLIDWTSNGTESTFSGGQEDDLSDEENYEWNFPFQNRDSNYPSSSDYIKFYVPYDESSGAATINVIVYLAPVTTNQAFFTYIHGVTVTKARNDLVTMSCKNNANNPFLGATNTWSRYSTSFKIPADYNNASDWIFRIRGGAYSCGEGTYPDGTASGDVNNQEVYIRNIQITGDTEDTITLLSSNNQSKSAVHLHSENQGNTWNENWIIFPETNASPSYNYGNGVLRISDSNFKTNNTNMLMYYDKYASNTYTNFRNSSGWKTKNGFLISPCNLAINVFETTSTTTFTNANEIFNACDLQNELFEGITFTTKGEGGNSLIATDWRYDCFGDITTNATDAKRMGIITRYIADNTRTPQVIYNNAGSEGNWIASYDTQFEPAVGNQNHPTTAGIGNVVVHSANHTDSGGHSNSMYTEALWPLKVLIPMPSLLEFSEERNMNTSSVHSVSFEIDYELQGCRQNNNGGDGGNGDFPNATHPMYFKVEGGIFGFPIASANYERFINGHENGAVNSYSDLSSLLQNKNTINFGINQHEDASNRWSKILDGGVQWTSDTGTGTISMLTNIDDIYQDNTDISLDRRINFKIRLNGTLYFERGDADVTSNDNLVIQIKDILDDVAGTNQVWGTEGHLERDIATWDTANPNACTKTTYWNCLNFASYTRYFVNKLDVIFYDDGILEEEILTTNEITPSISTGSNSEIFLNFGVPESHIAPSGWAERKFQIATTSVDIFDCESYINKNDELTQVIDANKCPEVTFYMTEDFFNNENVKTTKIYMKPNDSDTWYLQWYVNHKGNDAGKFYSNSSGMYSLGFSQNNNVKCWILDRDLNKDFNEINSYESETMVKQEDALTPGNLTCRYKASVIANNRLYVGNLKTTNGVIYGDRMIKSPINKYNILPASNFIDVAVNDGDEITALEYYKDKILQFKKRKVFVIDISGDYESLADTFDNVGVKGSYSVVKTPKGIAWANENGCYLYDGNSLTNLIEGVIPTSQAYENPGISNNRWSPSSSSGECIIGYDRNKDTLVVNFSKNNEAGVSAPSGATYHFKTNSWTLLTSVWNDNSGDIKTGNMSNMITGNDGNVLFYHITSDGANGVKTLRKWNHDSNDNLSTKLFTFTTKDITFGNINIRKKVYGVYITYRVRTNGTDSGVNVVAAVNGSNSFSKTFSSNSKFAFGQTNSSGTSCYSDASGTLTLNETDGIWKTAHLKPITPSDFNNITSIMLKFSGGSTPYDFEINDISIVYKNKSLK